MNKKQKIKFIADYPTYITDNARGYSHNVKIHSLPFSASECDALYEMLSTDDYFLRINDVVADWNAEMRDFGTYHQTISKRVNVEGLTEKEIEERRATYEKMGWTYDRHGTSTMVLEKIVRVADFTAAFAGRSGGHLVLYYKKRPYHLDIEDEDTTPEKIDETYKILKRFTSLRKALIEECKYIAKTCKVEEEEYTITNTRKILIEK